jgi:segregation and condensation protein B
MGETMDNLATVIEGILFASSTPMTAEQIIKIFPEEERPGIGPVRAILNELQNFYSDRGIHLCEVASGYRFQVAQEVAPFIQRTLEEKPQKYSRALLETLSLIAYRQPITRAEIEDIRGVAVSTNTVRTLTEQGWVRVIGHKEVPGRPALYATSKGFLDHFGLAHLEDLPPLAELKDLNEIDPNLAAAAQDEALQAEKENAEEGEESLTSKEEQSSEEAQVQDAEEEAELQVEIIDEEDLESEESSQFAFEPESESKDSIDDKLEKDSSEDSEVEDLQSDEEEFKDDDLTVLQ